MFIVHDLQLKNDIEKGIIKNGITIKDLECLDNIPIFFRNNQEAQNYINNVLKYDYTKQFLISNVNLKPKKI